MKRVAIYFFYDKEGIVDEYVSVFLSDLKKYIDKLVIVCNGKLTPESRQKLELHSSHLIVRENKGFDVWAYKEGIEYITWEEMNNYDEMLMINFTIAGPVDSFKEMFSEMDSKELDFWGITKFYKVNNDSFGTIDLGYIPEHIQSHFIAVRKRMFSSYEFKKYWKERPEIKSYSDAVGKHEAIFTKTFEDKGFVWDVYVKSDDLEKYTNCPILFYPKKLIEERKMPIFKRRSFFHSYDQTMEFSTGEPTIELYDYLKKKTSYNVDSLIENIIRTENFKNIKDNLHLNYVLPKNYLMNSNIKNIIKDRKIALVIHIHYEDMIESVMKYINSMPINTDIFIMTNSIDKKSKIKHESRKYDKYNININEIPNRGRDVSSLLLGFGKKNEEYDYVCFIHDKKVTQIYPLSIGESFAYKCFENTISTKEYVLNVINLFENNRLIGLLFPPPPNHSIYYSTLGNSWTNNYDNTKKLYEKLNLKSQISSSYDSIAPLGTMFWFRKGTLSHLFDKDWKYDDFPKEPNEFDGTLLHAIERIYTFVAQDNKFLSGWILTDNFARIEITNLSNMVSNLNSKLMKNYSFNSAYVLNNSIGNISILSILENKLKTFSKRFFPKKIYTILLRIYKFIFRKKQHNI